MSNIKIEIRKPQYLAAKESGTVSLKETGGNKTPFLFRMLTVSTYLLSAVAIWYVFQKFTSNP